jgi:hypothetical protein
MKPSTISQIDPMGSILRKRQSEVVALNAVIILKRTGDEFRHLSHEEYEAERRKDGNFHKIELDYLDKVQEFISSEEGARRFCSKWDK